MNRNGTKFTRTNRDKVFRSRNIFDPLSLPFLAPFVSHASKSKSVLETWDNADLVIKSGNTSIGMPLWLDSFGMTA